MKHFKNVLYAVLFLISICFTSCKKFLDEKSNKAITVPTTINDAQSLLDNALYENNYVNDNAGSIMDDDYYVLDSYYDGRSITARNQIIWDPAAMGSVTNWQLAYSVVNTANVALETLNKLSPAPNEISDYNLAKGSALFFRAFAHFNVSQIYTLPYQASTAGQNPGIPYKVKGDINEPTLRSSLLITFQQIADDLKEASKILPLTTNYFTRPTKPAAFGMLARVYLVIGDYQNAYNYADSALKINNQLLDYKQLTIPSPTSTTNPFPDWGFDNSTRNPEVLFFSNSSPLGAFSSLLSDTVLYMSYSSNDLRKSLYYYRGSDGRYRWRGGYRKSGMFSGVATDEIYLIRSECSARLNNVTGAMNDLNTLLRKRYNNTFVDLTAPDAQTALSLIIAERRKELTRRGNLRWYDIRRLNLEPSFAKTLIRVQHGITYTLPPNDLRYALLIPIEVIQNSGIEQNKR